MPSDITVDVKNVSRYYHQLCAVDDVSFELNSGEILGFLGVNGAGKSTTMKMICGTLAPTSGEITINGVNLLTEPCQAKTHIGYLPEQAPLYADLSVDEYLTYCAELRRMRGKKRLSAVKIAKERCGLEEQGKRLISHLSKGFQQRVGIAQAIVHDPPILILDEPSVGLDPIQIREIRQLIRDLGREHSIILSSHILPEIQSVCDRVQIIHNGKLALSASLEELDLSPRSLLFGCANPIDLQKIEQLNAVNSIDQLCNQLDNHLLRIHFEGQNPSEQLAELAVTEKWGLQLLQPERQNLEELFVEITAQETSLENVPEPRQQSETEH